MIIKIIKIPMYLIALIIVLLLRILSPILIIRLGLLDSIEIAQLRRKLQAIFVNDDQFLFRLNCLYPLFGLEWCMIVLNPFQSGYNINQQNDYDIKKKQLIKEKDLMKKILINKSNSL